MAVKVYIVYYAMDGNVESLAKQVEKGANSIEGVEAKLWQVLETLSTEELAKLGEPTKAKINTLNKLSKADGFFFGFPITFGNMVAQVKAFIDATGDLGKVEQLADKPTGIFITTRCQGGGKETM
ncbi:NAD(P)H dehydrogenase (quinone) FQR1-like [Glycine max]|uniref:NAD(P)H dehydrogenase (quinone) FQR1-like n=1 Tax=Glycine max TaxID=3847 RepID=UPI0003DE9D3E|nr:NAD(P)H dehydrogenase (quinone) FQR1-like [Glycine max]|eukprot:XP_006582685.1 NAD(P)H dehydrogenase (quinone) FQR1-like [Glycine max]